MNINKTAFLMTFLFSGTFAQANIPPELLYQPPSNPDQAEISTIQGFQKTTTSLKFVKAHIYITSINSKATLDQYKDWKKIYQIPIGETTIRYISDAQQLFSSGEITFNAQAGQHYQIQNNQAEKDSLKNGLEFWIENLDTHENVTPKQYSNAVSSNQPQPSYLPVIINK
nr:hypothetical protein [Acinetobacter sp. Marseille-Q1620]